MTTPLPLVMGVLNVTPDSFSDGGAYVDPAAALAHAERLIADGAQIIDVGGESTRPGAERITPAEEQRRVLPVVEALASRGIAVSIDTVHADTARLAVAAGASIINDVSGGTADSEMRRVAADTGADFIIMHWRGIPDPSHRRSSYHDVVAEVRDELAVLADAAVTAGVDPARIILDPGLGFDKTEAQGWQLLAGLDSLRSLGYRVLVGISRKRMLGALLAGRVGGDETMADRDAATATVSALSAQVGAWAVRVHDARSTAAALAVAEAWGVAEASPPSPGEAKDRITLTGLEVFAHHGVFDFEREAGQRFLIDAELTVSVTTASLADELGNTVNYAELADAIIRDASERPVDLIETLAERLAAIALSFAGVREARITVHKPDAPIDAVFADVSVTVVRRAGESQ
ncbi:MAG: dihydropteroate synthase [Microbacteriaceae bacterium]|nr:dihydropteroate synthase [Microbacteriaceae bacterium]